MDDPLQILKVWHADGAFGSERLAPAQADPGRWREGEVFTVALVVAPLDDAATALALDCDFLAIAAAGALNVDDGPLVRRRLGAALAPGARLERPLAADRALALGLAALRIAPDLNLAAEQVLRQCETLLALAQARRVSAPDWFVAF